MSNILDEILNEQISENSFTIPIYVHIGLAFFLINAVFIFYALILMCKRFIKSPDKFTSIMAILFIFKITNYYFNSEIICFLVDIKNSMPYKFPNPIGLLTDNVFVTFEAFFTLNLIIFVSIYISKMVGEKRTKTWVSVLKYTLIFSLSYGFLIIVLVLVHEFDKNTQVSTKNLHIFIIWAIIISISLFAAINLIVISIQYLRDLDTIDNLLYMCDTDILLNMFNYEKLSKVYEIDKSGQYYKNLLKQKRIEDWKDQIYSAKLKKPVFFLTNKDLYDKIDTLINYKKDTLYSTTKSLNKQLFKFFSYFFGVSLLFEFILFGLFTYPYVNYNITNVHDENILIKCKFYTFAFESIMLIYTITTLSFFLRYKKIISTYNIYDNAYESIEKNYLNKN